MMTRFEIENLSPGDIVVRSGDGAKYMVTRVTDDDVYLYGMPFPYEKSVILCCYEIDSQN